MYKKEMEMKRMTIEEALNNNDFKNEYGIIIVNDDKPFTFTKKDYATKEGIPKYTDAIKNKKSGSATAIISRNTLAIFTSENIDYPNPIGWSDKISKDGFYNRSHIVAYSLSAKRCDKDNIFIGTEYLNKTTMKDIEYDIYSKINEENRIYLYKVTPMYKNKHSSIPYAILIEAETMDDGKKDTVCRLCYNVQKGRKIDYYKYEGVEYRDKDQEDKTTARYKHYSINVRTKTFHLLNEKVKCMQKIDPKYIQETKAREEDIINRKFKLCRRCTNYNKRKDEAYWN